MGRGCPRQMVERLHVVGMNRAGFAEGFNS